MTASTKEALITFARRMRIPLYAHHVTVHANGRCFIRSKALHRFKIPPYPKVCIHLNGDGNSALLVFIRKGQGSRVVHPSENGQYFRSIYFYSRTLARAVASTGQRRFRFEKPGKWRPDGAFSITLLLSPVKDLSAILNEITHHGKTDNISRG